jgi:AcrR family transcriptional regulator
MERILAKRPNKESGGARERLIDSAYELFAAHGVGQTGIDAILEKAGCAKASLYDHFGSKLDLATAFLDRREERWTRAWLEAEITKRASDPVGRLLAVFDVFDGWFRRRDFEGCSFINVLLESEPGSKLRRAASIHLANIRAVMRGLAEEAGLTEPEAFAQAWHIMMKGSIVAAGEGNRNAAREAKRAAALVVAGWPRGPQLAARRRKPAPSSKPPAPKRQSPKRQPPQRRKDAVRLQTGSPVLFFICSHEPVMLSNDGSTSPAGGSAS